MTSRFMGFYTFVCNCRYLKLIPFQKIYDTISKSDLVNLTMKPYVIMVLSKKPIVYEPLKIKKFICSTLLKVGFQVMYQFLIRNHAVSVIGKKLTNHFSYWKSLAIRRLKTKKFQSSSLFIILAIENRKPLCIFSKQTDVILEFMTNYIGLGSIF